MYRTTEKEARTRPCSLGYSCSSTTPGAVTFPRSPARHGGGGSDPQRPYAPTCDCPSRLLSDTGPETVHRVLVCHGAQLREHIRSGARPPHSTAGSCLSHHIKWCPMLLSCYKIDIHMINVASLCFARRS